jgi:hypothetical protein
LETSGRESLVPLCGSVLVFLIEFHVFPHKWCTQILWLFFKQGKRFAISLIKKSFMRSLLQTDWLGRGQAKNTSNLLSRHYST